MLFISVIQPVKGAQFLNITCLFFLSAAHAASSASASITVMIPLGSTIASL